MRITIGTPEMNDYEFVEVEMSAPHLDPESKYFTHCKIKFDLNRSRTIDNHIKYFETICEGLRNLKEKLEDPA
ncbi:hypothetical protein [uncultured Megamonas sp.]|uniref:hypothetical protein n=1 Tax=uncultured Megamonas sp. TaxID=286140 RepID=UPI00259BD3DD|nr:hypothetical protein [uncultured Megamonas sp.]